MKVGSDLANRRELLQGGLAFLLPVGLITLLGGCENTSTVESALADGSSEQESDLVEEHSLEKIESMKVQYLEIVTPDVDSLCQHYAAVHQVTFSEPEANLGGARTVKLADGGILGIRAPLRDTETPVVRPYWLVQDIQAAVEAATAAGAELALPPMELPGHGTCAIVIQGGIETGLWQVG